MKFQEDSFYFPFALVIPKPDKDTARPILEEGATYVFRVVAETPNGESSSEIEISVNAPPSDGFIEV